ncbi:hsp70 family protein [Gigaspora margarita]|uniref:Hsp70 family protein n=1 Tax=Gigaspora margarita TaxID=4874 RepID=A0A8H4AV55_GIGMA|nr:hsp70 family protein [Gigaspora margarita]
MSKQNSYFWNDNSKNRISQDDENKLILQNILIPKQKYYNLYIAMDPSIPNFSELSKKYQLSKGRKIHDHDDTFVVASKSAFTIKNPHMINVNLQCKFERVHDRMTEEYIKSYELGSVRLSRKVLEPTERYIREIEEALDESKCNDEKKRDLDMVGEEYGFFWPQEIKFGMKYRYSVDNNNNIVNSNISDDLKSFDNWEIIKYGDILSLYELLPDNLKHRIKQTIGMRMLHSDVLPVIIPKNHDFKFPLVTETLTKPDEISTFKDCKIFVSVYNETNRNPYHNIYGIYVYYKHEESPCLVINRTGPLKISSETKLFIPWMIFGYDKFPTKPLSKLNVEYIEHINTTENAVTDINFQIPIKEDHCWIGTNTLFHEDNQSYELGKTNVMITHYFCSKTNTSVQACYKLNPVTSPLRFKLNYMAILKTDMKTIGLTREEWKSRERHFSRLQGRSTFTGEKWNLPKDKRYVFASILYPDSLSTKERYSLLLNINPKYPIIKSLVEIGENPKCRIKYVMFHIVAKRINNQIKTVKQEELSLSENNTVKKNSTKKNINTKENIDQRKTTNREEMSQSMSDNIEGSKGIINMIENETVFNENTINFYKFNHGLIFNSQEIYSAINRVFDSEPKIKEDINKCHIKVASPKDRRELFLLNNFIDVPSFQSLPPKLVNIMMQSTNFLNNPSLNNFYFEANFPQVELNFEKEFIKPTEELKIAVNNALNNEKPFQELIKVFNTFGYLLSQKLILGQKLYRSCILLQGKQSIINQQLEIKENYSSELHRLFILWKNQYGFDEEYFISVNGEAIGKNGIEKWLNEHLKNGVNLLQVIDRSELIPLYEIFEEPISRNIKSILGLDNLPKILMTGIVQIVKNAKYYNINFPSDLESSNITFSQNDRTGFLAIIEKFDEISDLNPEDLQIMWMLIGFLDEINFYSMHTRELSILSVGYQDVILDNNDNKTGILINIPENLPENSRIVLSFEFPLSSDFIKNQDGKIELDYLLDDDNNNDVYSENAGSESEPESDEDKSEDSSFNSEYKIKFPLYSYIFISNKEFIKTDIPTSKYQNINIKAMGSLIG